MKWVMDCHFWLKVMLKVQLLKSLNTVCVAKWAELLWEVKAGGWAVIGHWNSLFFGAQSSAEVSFFGTHRSVETDFCWSTDVRSYSLKASTDLCPVLSCISFSGTFDSNNLVAPVALREWFDFPSTPISWNIIFTIEASVFRPMTCRVNHGALSLNGTLSFGFQ